MNPRKWCLFPQKSNYSPSKWMFTPKYVNLLFVSKVRAMSRFWKHLLCWRTPPWHFIIANYWFSCIFPCSAFSNTITGAAGVPPGPKFCSTTCAQIDEEFGHLGQKQKTWKPRNGLCVKSKIYEMWCQVVEEQHLKMPSSLRWYTCN